MKAGARVHTAQASWIILSNFFRKIYLQRDLIRNFVVRDLRARYIGSFMGFFWSVIHPTVLLASYAFVFMVVFGATAPPNSGTDSYPLFLFCGIIPWLLFQDTVQRSSTVIVDNTNLVTKTIFPTEILPLTVMLAGFVNHLIQFAILLVLIFWLIGQVTVFILLVPVYLLVLMLFTQGMAWFISSLNVFVRDISQILSVVLTFWFWFTPIFYSASQAESKFKQFSFVISWNPLAQIVTGYRDCLLARTMPDIHALAWLSLAALAIFIAGGLFFRNIKRAFVDVL